MPNIIYTKVRATHPLGCVQKRARNCGSGQISVIIFRGVLHHAAVAVYMYIYHRYSAADDKNVLNYSLRKSFTPFFHTSYFEIQPHVLLISDQWLDVYCSSHWCFPCLYFHSDLKRRVSILIDGSLIIAQVKPEDNGKYTCAPSNSLGRPPTASAYLTVQCECADFVIYCFLWFDIISTMKVVFLSVCLLVSRMTQIYWMD